MGDNAATKSSFFSRRQAHQVAKVRAATIPSLPVLYAWIMLLLEGMTTSSLSASSPASALWSATRSYDIEFSIHASTLVALVSTIVDALPHAESFVGRAWK
jgi:hypothetical protein